MSPAAKPKFKNPRAKYNFQGRTCSITGVGSYVPAKVLTNTDLEKMVETSDDWITTRTGIKERRLAAHNEFTSDLATQAALRALELARLSPLAEWHYKTAHKDSFVDVSRAQRVLGWQPRLSNRETLIETYDWYLANRERVGGAGVTHRVPWNQQALGLLKRLS